MVDHRNGIELVFSKQGQGIHGVLVAVKRAHLKEFARRALHAKVEPLRVGHWPVQLAFGAFHLQYFVPKHASNVR